jgi:integrase
MRGVPVPLTVTSLPAIGALGAPLTAWSWCWRARQHDTWVLMLVLGLRRGEVLGLIWESIDESALEIGLEWQLVVVSGQPVKHKQQLKTDGSTDVLPLPPICLPALAIARGNQAKVRTDEWPDKCICGEKHALVFRTATGLPIHPRKLCSCTMPLYGLCFSVQPFYFPWWS